MPFNLDGMGWVRLQIFRHVLDLACLTRLDRRAIEIEIDRVGREALAVLVHLVRIKSSFESESTIGVWPGSSGLVRRKCRSDSRLPWKRITRPGPLRLAGDWRYHAFLRAATDDSK